MQCATHPDVETQLTCQRCGKAICHRCRVETPVGFRCAECGRSSRNPLLSLTTEEAARVAATAVAAAFLGGIAWGVVKGIGISFGFISIVAALGIGYAIAEAVSAAARRKPVHYLPWLAAAVAIGAFLVGNVADWVFWGEDAFGNSVPFSEAITHVGDFGARGAVWGVLSMLLSAAMAFSRLR